MRMQDLAEPNDLPHMLELLGHAVHTGEGFVAESGHAMPGGARAWIRNSVSAITDQGGDPLAFDFHTPSVPRTAVG